MHRTLLKLKNLNLLPRIAFLSKPQTPRAWQDIGAFRRFRNTVSASLSVFFLSSGIGFADMLERIDTFRLPSGQVTVDFSIKTSNGQTTKFKSDQNGKGSSLATIVSKGNRGEKYLYTPQGLWLFAPGSRRTIRIPKIQSLRGETVVGDITQLRFDDDYRIANQSSATLKGKNVTKLVLTAKSRASTFHAINLYVNSGNLVPVFAEYYLTSGKLFRTADFGKIKSIAYDGASIKGLADITFSSPRGEKTRLRIDKIVSRRFPNGYFSPNALQK